MVYDFHYVLTVYVWEPPPSKETYIIHSNEKEFAAAQINIRVQFITYILSSVFSRKKIALYDYLHSFLSCWVEVHYLSDIYSLEVTSGVFFVLNLTILAG